MLRVVDQSKYHGVGYFHPFIRPSFLSIILVFVCGILFMKNEETNDRLFALEQQMAVVIEECDLMRMNARQEEIPTTEYNGESKRSTPTRSSMAESLFSTLSEPVEERSSTLEHRFRRQATVNATRERFSTEDIRREISFQLGKFIPNNYCRSNARVCPAGPPGRPGPRGSKGSRGRRGPKGSRGKTGTQGITGPPGKYGKPGMTGPTGPRGIKGEVGSQGPRGATGIAGERGQQGETGAPGRNGNKGDRGSPGPKGVPGPPGIPGKSISAPQTVLLPVENTVNERENTTFNCTASGNPTPRIEWKFESEILSSGLKYSIEEGILTINQLNFSDTGLYSCLATSALGSAEASSSLTVRAAPIFTKKPPSMVMPFESTDFTEICQAEGFPTPVANWSRLLQPFPLPRTELGGGNLTITNLSTTDSGLYECAVMNSMGAKKTRMNLVVQKGVDCSCWRSEEKIPNVRSYWSRSSFVEAVDFQTSSDIILRGYRLWNDRRLFRSSYSIAIQLFQGNSSIANKSLTYDARFPSKKTFEVYFSRYIHLQAGVKYTAVVKMPRSGSYVAQNSAMNYNFCSGVNVTFMKSGMKRPKHSSYVQQIPALIFLSLKC